MSETEEVSKTSIFIKTLAVFKAPTPKTHHKPPNWKPQPAPRSHTNKPAGKQKRKKDGAKLTFSPLKMDGWNTFSFPFGVSAIFFSGAICHVSFREGKPVVTPRPTCKMIFDHSIHQGIQEYGILLWLDSLLKAPGGGGYFWGCFFGHPKSLPVQS